ncbi:MAG: hypothetical protein AAB091_00250 [Elusimicrobiota bacterium]
MVDSGKKTHRLLFVCTGNTCRSVMAEHLCRKLAKGPIEAASAGIAASPYFPVPSAIGRLLEQEGVKDFHHTPALLVESKINWADFIFVMEPSHRRHILEKFPKAKEKTFLLKKFARDGADQKVQDGQYEAVEIPFDVADPIGGSQDVYERCFKEIKKCVKALLRRLNYA